MNTIKEWVPGSFPIPFFQTWCCKNSAITPPPPLDISCVPELWSCLKNAGLPPKMYDCVRDNLILNRVGQDCIHYLFNDSDCRAFIMREYPPDVLTAYDRLIPTAFKADLWRYCVLYKYGGMYLDVKYGGGSAPQRRDLVRREPNDAILFGESRTMRAERRSGASQRSVAAERRSGASQLRSIDQGGANEPAQASGVGDGDGDGDGCLLREIVERFFGAGCGGGGDDDVFVLERDAVGLWPTGRFGIHNAFIIVKPKNPILFECICRIVSAAKNWKYARGGLDDDYSAGWMTRALFVTGPGLLGDVWREGGAQQRGVPPPNGGGGGAPQRRNYVRMAGDGGGGGGGGDGGGDGDGGVCGSVPDSYATMAPYFRFFFEGDGVIGYYNGCDSYVRLFKVYDGYQEEIRHMMVHSNCIPHYTILWSQGCVWGG